MKITFLPRRLIGWGACAWGLSLLLVGCSWGEGDPPEAGHLVGGKPVGLFLVKTKPGATARYYFSPTGVAYKNPWGLSKAALDTAYERRGNFRITGSKLSIDWLISPPNYFDVDSGNVSRLPAGFSWGRNRLAVAAGPFQSPSQLVGTFVGHDSAYAFQTYRQVVYRAFTFRADSTYTGSCLDTVAAAAAGCNSAPPGYWQLKGWYLTLIDAQGHATRDFAYPVGSRAGQVTHFIFSGMTYARH
ncbi:hypothetical protein [Hymenobacter cheonanensis]|uniref:hypothetical protein n=1 Tax=Hymenobacter sp. CA2-7 TaxID=3063993 RepID=UPI00271406AC|nr:hypothetical protein [Hymenobacter sp. CA2-7]MDO7884080.1 hypothetical protein [Hymenobacter sp. CA2-7]